MSVPTNTTPATAIAIPSNALPYALTVSAADLSDTPQGAGHTTSGCDTDCLCELWWTYTTGPTQTVIGVRGDVTGAGNYESIVQPWTGPLAALVRYELFGQDYCCTNNDWYQIVIAANTQVFFQVTAQTAGPFTNGLVFRAIDSPQLAAPAGSLVVPNDDPGYPAIVFASAGTVLRLIPTPATEFADTLPTGETAFGSNARAQDVEVWNAGLTVLIANVTFPGKVVGVISNRVDTFYIAVQDLLTPFDQHVYTLNAAGVVAATSWALPVNARTARTFAVTQNNTIFYYGSFVAAAVVHAYDLVGHVALADLHAAFGTEQLCGPGDGFCLADGSVVFGYSGVSAVDGKLRRFNAAGTVLNTYTLGATFFNFNHFCYNNDTSFVAWGFTNAGRGTSVFRCIKISDGTTIYETPGIVTVGQGGGPSVGDAPFPISSSCPVFALSAALGSPSSPLPPQPPMPTTHSRRIRRVRQCPHLADPQQHRVAFYSRFELVCQAGQAPLNWQLEYSNDGDYTWKGPLLRTTGLSQYSARAIWNRHSSARDKGFRIANSDDAKVVVLDALVDVEVGIA